MGVDEKKIGMPDYLIRKKRRSRIKTLAVLIGVGLGTTVNIYNQREGYISEIGTPKRININEKRQAYILFFDSTRHNSFKPASKAGRSIKHEAKQIPSPYPGLVILEAGILQGFPDKIIRNVVVKTFKKYRLPNIIAVMIVRSYKFYRLEAETEIINVSNPYNTNPELLNKMNKIFATLALLLNRMKYPLLSRNLSMALYNSPLITGRSLFNVNFSFEISSISKVDNLIFNTLRLFLSCISSPTKYTLS